MRVSDSSVKSQSREYGLISPVKHLILAPLGLFLFLLVSALSVSPKAALLPVALLLGWTQIGGKCGRAHVNTMWVLRQLSQTRYRKASTAYVAAGTVSAAAVGMSIGIVGRFLWESLWNSSWLALLLPISALLIGRELRLWRMSLPEWQCQTERNWAYTFGFVRASIMWGFHIGLGFATVITYGGFWLLVLLIAAIGSPAEGALLMIAYWVGRGLPLWLVSPYIESPIQCEPEENVFRPLHAIGLIAATGIIIVQLRHIYA